MGVALRILSIFVLMATVNSFGYVAHYDVKNQLENCMAAVNICKIKCLADQESHDEFLATVDESFRTIHSHVHKMTGERAEKFCEECKSNMWDWEATCLQKLYNNDFFWQ